MRTTSSRYRAVVLVVSVLTLLWVAAPVSAQPNIPPVAGDDAYDVAVDDVLEVSPPGLLANDTDEDGDALMIPGVRTFPANGSLPFGVLPDGAFTYVPNPGFTGTDSFLYWVTDGIDGVLGEVTFTVIAPPTAVSDDYTLDEDGLLEIPAPGLLGNDTDPLGLRLQVSQVGEGPSHGTLDWARDGSFTYEPVDDFYGTDTFKYKARNRLLFSNIVTVTIDVMPVNDAPVAGDDAYSVDEDQLLTVDAPGLLANDTDVDGDTLHTYGVRTDPSHGTANLPIGTGTFSYEPDANFHGTDTFTYWVGDGELFDWGVVTITVEPVNDRPIAVGDSYTVVEDTMLEIAAPGLLVNDGDVDGDSLRAVKRSDPAHGTLTAFGGDGSFKYVPNLDYNGPDSFSYRVTDGMLNSNTVRVALTIEAVNDAPVAVEDVYRVAEDEVLTISAPGVLGNDTDVEGDTLTAHLDVDTADGDLTTFRRNGSFVYEPAADFHGTDAFGYHANDGTANSEIVRVRIIVLPVNDVPVAMADAYETMENTRLVVGDPGVLDNDKDADGDRLWARLVDDPLHGDLTAFAANGAFTYVPEADFAGTDWFTYFATDNTDRSEVVRVTITVIADNEAPTAVADEYEVAKNGELTVAAPGVLGNDTDPDGDALEAVLDTAPLHGTLLLDADGSFTYEPDAGYVGPDGFRYHATDGELDSNIVRATINVRYECNGVIATIVGTSGADVIHGTAGDDVIVGLKGNDEIHGGAGNDLICGGGGFDRLYGDEGDDRLEGWAGRDRLFGGDGDDVLKGEGKNDLLKGGYGDDILIGGKGFDRMFGNQNNDYLKANDGMEDKLNGGRGFDKARLDEMLDIWTSIERIL